MNNAQRQLGRFVFLLAVQLALPACAAAPTAQLFSDPESLAGQNVVACGVLHYQFENHNLYATRRDARKGEQGLAVSKGRVTEDELLLQHRKKVCVAGVVRYLGCADTMICLDSNFDYEIVVDELIRR